VDWIETLPLVVSVVVIEPVKVTVLLLVRLTAPVEEMFDAFTVNAFEVERLSELILLA
jgi:hypothetical protein